MKLKKFGKIDLNVIKTPAIEELEFDQGWI
jgi:hypothetical protein